MAVEHTSMAEVVAEVVGQVVGLVEQLVSLSSMLQKAKMKHHS
jgi:hypothetical protein